MGAVTRRRRRPTVSSRPDWPQLRIDDDTTAREVVAQLLDREHAAEPDPHSDWVAAHFVLRAVEYALDMAGSPVPPFDGAAAQALCDEVKRRLYYDDDADLLDLTESADIDVMAEVLKVDLNGRVRPAYHPPPRFAAPSSSWVIEDVAGDSSNFSEDDPSTWVVQRVVGDIRGPDVTEAVDRFVATWVPPPPKSRPWIEVTAGIAERLLVNLHLNGWSGQPMLGLRPKYCADRAARFIGCFGPTARFFTNVDTKFGSEPLINVTRFYIFPDAWWDAGVVALDGRHIGHDWRWADPP